MFSHPFGPTKQFDTNAKLSLGCKVYQIRLFGIGYPISVLIWEIAYPWGIPLRLAFCVPAEFFKSLIFEISILFYIRTHLQTFGLSHLIKGIAGSWTISVGLSTVDRDLNQYKIVVPLFGAAYAAPNKGTSLYSFSSTNVSIIWV